MQDDGPFILDVKDRDGTPVDASQCQTRSLIDAALIGNLAPRLWASGPALSGLDGAPLI
jgi:hypothetical protein